MWHFKWFRRIVRRHTRPIPEDKAVIWTRRLTLAYMFLGWNAFGMICYMIFSGRKDWGRYYGFKKDEDEHSTGQGLIKKLGGENAIVYRIGFHQQGENKISEQEFNHSESWTEHDSK